MPSPEVQPEMQASVRPPAGSGSASLPNRVPSRSVRLRLSVCDALATSSPSGSMPPRLWLTSTLKLSLTVKAAWPSKAMLSPQGRPAWAQAAVDGSAMPSSAALSKLKLPARPAWSRSPLSSSTTPA